MLREIGEGVVRHIQEFSLKMRNIAVELISRVISFWIIVGAIGIGTIGIVYVIHLFPKTNHLTRMEVETSLNQNQMIPRRMQTRNQVERPINLRNEIRNVTNTANELKNLISQMNRR